MIKKVIRPWTGPKFDFKIDVRVQLADGTWKRAKRGFKGSQKEAEREADQIAFSLRDNAEAESEQNGGESKVAPTLEDFRDRFISEHLEATRAKPSTIDTYESRLDLHLLPHLGKLR